MRLDSCKKATYNLEVTEYDADLTDEYVYPVSSGVCKPGNVIVSVGQYVRMGQKIIDAGKGISACQHSSVSGKVVAIEPRDITGGENVLSVVIKNDRQYVEKTPEKERNDGNTYMGENVCDSLSRQQITDIIREAGIIGMGGAGFPAHIKYMVKEPEKIKYIIANAAECEPYITSDYRLLREHMEEIEGGLKILKNIFPNAQTIIAGRDVNGHVSGKCDYPHGAERQLIYSVTGYKLKNGELPFKAGCIVNNVHTISAVYNAVCRRMPLIKRIVTVTGEGIHRPGNYLVRTGADIQDIINACGGLRNDSVCVIAGGPMMGTALKTLHVPVLKTTSGIVCLEYGGSDKRMTSCIRCGRCIQVCPCGLKPCLEKADRECIGCGCCSYVCPAGRELTLSMHGRKKG